MKTQGLTRFKPGSLGEISSLSFPLMLSALAGSLMMFFDRLILAHYSTAAMNGVVAVSMLIATLQYAAIAISNIAEVFVGQYNGSEQARKIGEPVWQMIWFSLGTAAVFIPVALLTGPYVVPEHYYHLSLPYYQLVMAFAWLPALGAALAAFFIGQGKVSTVTTVVIACNVINILLDIALVFGIDGVIPSLGTRGAALATVLSQILMCLIFLYLFLQKKYRTTNNTHIYQFNWPAFKQCLRIGLPNAIGHVLEIGAWALIMYMMIWTSDLHITIMAIGQSFYMLFVFISDGLNKGVMASASNLIGAKYHSLVSRSLRSGITVLMIMAIVVAIPMLIFRDVVIDAFLPHQLTFAHIDTVQHLAELALIWVWFTFIIDGIIWILAGVLTAAGDTKFVMVMSAIAGWCFGVTPIYIFVVHLGGPPILPWQLATIYVSLTALCFLWRYRSGPWRQLNII